MPRPGAGSTAYPGGRHRSHVRTYAARMEPVVARKMWRTLEPYHSFVYFAPAGQHLDYFASRAAAMGRVPAEVVIATFFNFNPEMVRRSIPAAWDRTSPAELVEQRRAA